MRYRIKELVFDAFGSEDDELPLIELNGWRIVEVMDWKHARLQKPEKWYVTVLVEGQ